MKNLRTCINWLDREQMKDLLENTAGMAVYDNESDDDLREALFQCVTDGDIDEEAIRSLVE